MKKFFRQMFTGKDNTTIDIGRIIWFESIQAFIILTVYHIWKGGAFDAVTWGGGLATLIAAGGAALGMKANVEPIQVIPPAFHPIGVPTAQPGMVTAQPIQQQYPSSAQPYPPPPSPYSPDAPSDTPYGAPLDNDGFPQVITKKNRQAGL